MGVHAPKLETVESLRKFCKKHRISTYGMLMISKDDIIENCSKFNSKDLLFDENGFCVNYAKRFDNQSCSGNIVTTLESIIPKSFIERDSLLTFQKESQKWVTFEDTSITANISLSKGDYTLVSYWNTYAGKPNHIKRFSKLKKALESNKNCSISHIYVNQDFRSDMDIELNVKMR